MGLQSDYHELNIEDGVIPEDYLVYGGLPYNPMADRNVCHGEGTVTTSKAVKAGEELLDNYMSYGGEQGFSKFVVEMRKQCAGDVGEIEEYQSWEILNKTDPNRTWCL
jgi:hypothetical protein